MMAKADLRLNVSGIKVKVVDKTLLLCVLASGFPDQQQASSRSAKKEEKKRTNELDLVQQ